MTNISKDILNKQKNVIPLTDYALTVGHLCEITLNNGIVAKGKFIKKHADMINTKGEILYKKIYSYDCDKILLEKSYNEYAFISLKEEFVIDIDSSTFASSFKEWKDITKFDYKDDDYIGHVLWADNTIKRIEVINYFTKITNYNDLPLLLDDSCTHFIKISGYSEEIKGVFIDTDIGQSFMDCRGEIHGAAYPYVFIFAEPFFKLGPIYRTFMPIDRECFNNKEREDSLSVDYIRKGLQIR